MFAQHRHNAFRSLGAASLEKLQTKPLKVNYFYVMYDPIYTGIIPHPYYLNEINIKELAGFDFVFVSVDNGPSRGLICSYLRINGIRFIDVGMGLSKVESSMSIRRNCRITLCTPNEYDHIEACVDTHEDQEEALYTNNIR